MRLGDLDALKEEFDRPFWEKWEWEFICKCIDNAPTVEPQKEIVPVCKVNFDKDQLQEIVDKKIAEMKEQPQDDWIPVSERLPEKANQSYLVTVDYGGVVCSCQRFFFSEDIGWNDDCVIAWQPLPKPYKKGDTE